MKKVFVFAVLCFSVTIRVIAQSDVTSNADDLTRTKLLALFSQANKIEVSKVGKEPSELYRSTDKADITAMREAFVVDQEREGWIAICADTLIVLYKDDRELISFLNAGGTGVATKIVNGDYFSVDTEKWQTWFDKRGMGFIRKDYDEAVSQAKIYEEHERRWIEAMPRGVKKALEDTKPEMISIIKAEYPKIEIALKTEYPNQVDRIRALLHWYGSGSGQWSGYPSYESVAETALLKYRTSELLAAVKSGSLSEMQKEGAARLFAGWDFNRTRPNDGKLIGKKLKAMLLEHVLKSSDEDKRERALAHLK